MSMQPDSTAATKPKGTRKKDRRSVATEAHIKEGLLSKLRGKRFGELTVSEVCREAGITRATFYQHYGSLADVLDEVLDDVTGTLGDVPLEMCEACSEIGSAPGDTRLWQGMPFCHFYASRNPHRVLLEDNAIAERLIERIVDRALPNMMASIRKRRPDADIDMAQLRYLNIFRMSGCLAAAKAARRNGYDWSLVQPALDSAIAAAIESLDG